MPGSYPRHWETDVVVSDGGTVYIRPIKPTDGPGISSLHERLSPESVYFRYFTPMPHIPEKMLNHLVNVDYADRMALIALLGDQIIAVARYDRFPGTTEAEVAFSVDDVHQGRGLGGLMLEFLAASAQENGITRFVAETLPSNTRMLRVFHDAGYKDRRSFDEGTIRVSFDIERTFRSLEIMHERERKAVARSITKLLSPQVIAVVGASRVPGSVGHIIFRNLLDSNFQGVAYPVNAHATAVCSVRAYTSIRDLPEDIDLAIVVVSADQTEAVVEDAAAKHCGALVIIAAGFSDLNPEGAALEKKIVRLARRNGMRVVGPASMGVASLSPTISLNATLSPIAPEPGYAALHSQSGPLSLAILEEARRRGLGISSFVSSGNKADVSGNDLLRYWEMDEQTKAIMLYIEDFGNPRTFARVARRVSTVKPVIAVKAKRYSGTRRQPTQLQAVPTDLAVDALFQRTGVIRVDTLEQLFEQAQAMIDQPLPQGRRVGLLSNIGGPAQLCADACRSQGLEIPRLTRDVQEKLRSSLPVDSRVGNPIELSAAAMPSHFRIAASTLLESEEVDAVIVLYIPTVVGSVNAPSLLAAPEAGGRLKGTPAMAISMGAEVASAVADAVEMQPEEDAKPVYANFLSLPGVPPALRRGSRPIPSFSFPEAAAMALGRAWEYMEWRSKGSGHPIEIEDVALREVEESVDATLGELPRIGRGEDPEQLTHLPIPQGQLWELLEHYGIHIPTDAERVASRGGAGVVRLKLSIVHDVLFGPLVELSLSGEIAELVGTRILRSTAQSDLDALEIIESMPGAQILNGYRSIPKIPKEPLADLIMRISKLADDIFELSSLDLDPVLLTENGILVEEARGTLANWAPAATVLTRALRDV